MKILVVAILLASLVGCTALPGPAKHLPNPFGPSMKERALKKQVDSDPFPAAQQGGL
jgi:hypothetical protein